MTAIVAAILYNFRNLVHFSGRDVRAQFWPYAIFLFVLQSIVSMALTIPITVNVMFKAFQFGMQHAATNGGQMSAADQRALEQIVNGIYTERYTRKDHNNLAVTVSIDDPAIYTKPWDIAANDFKWSPDQDFEEQICVPSEGIKYREIVGVPAGDGSGNAN